MGIPAVAHARPAAGQRPRRLALVHDSRTRAWSVHHPVMGRAVRGANPGLAGVCGAYFFAPDQALPVPELPLIVQKRSEVLGHDALITPILNGPIVAPFRRRRPVRIRARRCSARKPDTSSTARGSRRMTSWPGRAAKPKASTPYEGGAGRLSPSRRRATPDLDAPGGTSAGAAWHPRFRGRGRRARSISGQVRRPTWSRRSGRVFGRVSSPRPICVLPDPGES